jgi:hypothetical protein
VFFFESPNSGSRLLLSTREHVQLSRTSNSLMVCPQSLVVRAAETLTKHGTHGSLLVGGYAGDKLSGRIGSPNFGAGSLCFGDEIVPLILSPA